MVLLVEQEPPTAICRSVVQEETQREEVLKNRSSFSCFKKNNGSLNPTKKYATCRSAVGFSEQEEPQEPLQEKHKALVSNQNKSHNFCFINGACVFQTTLGFLVSRMVRSKQASRNTKLTSICFLKQQFQELFVQEQEETQINK